MFTIKDCLFGQIRAVDDNVYRNHNIPGEAMPTTIPDVLKSHVTEQQYMTWDNATGMNPLWDRPPGDNVIYDSYGNMLIENSKLAKRYGYTFIEKLINESDDPDFYHNKIKEDYANDYSLLCASLGFWWHINTFLNQPDALDYDYLVVRQYDTWYYPLMSQRKVDFVFKESLELLGINDPEIPTVHVSRLDATNFPTTTFVHAFFYMFNRAAVKKLRDNFLKHILGEIEFYNNTTNKRDARIYGKSGIIMHNICTKNNIVMIDTVDEDEIFCWIPTGRSPGCANYGRTERLTAKIDLE